MIEPTTSAPVATTTTTSACARSIGETPRSASASATHAARPSRSCVRASTLVSIASRTAMKPTIAMNLNDGISTTGISTAELELVPRRHGCELEQRTAAARLRVAEVGALLVPGDLQQTLLHAMVEPGAAEDELAQPVH